MTDNAVSTRLATQADLAALLALEQSGFAGDRFNEEQIDYLLTRARASIFIAESGGCIAGAAYMLWRKAYGAGRLYNLVVDPSFRSRGIGRILMDECERETTNRGRTQVRLEVRCDNTNAIRFYEQRGYQIRATIQDYYEDGAPAYKMTRELPVAGIAEFRAKVPYHAQTLDFTCGPACLMMVLKYFLPDLHLTRSLEIRLWREATVVFLASGVGGTGPFGLALAAVRRSLGARVVNSSDTPPFQRSVRSEQKREVIRLVHEDMRKEALKSGVAASTSDFALEDLTAALLRGYIPIALISTYRLTGDRVPHWVVVTGFDRDHVYIHDPDEDSYHHDRTLTRNMKLSRAEFNRMSRFGKDVFRSMVLIGPRRDIAAAAAASPAAPGKPA